MFRRCEGSTLETLRKICKRIQKLSTGRRFDSDDMSDIISLDKN